MDNVYHKIKNNVIQHESEPVLNGNETVLVVDDVELIRNFLKDALPIFGYSVICAEDGMDGLNKFMENKDKIHIMLIDIVMPKLNGIELFNRIKRLEPESKVIFMSGYNDIFDRNIQQEKIKCISKPFKIDTVLKEIRGVLDKS